MKYMTDATPRDDGYVSMATATRTAASDAVASRYDSSACSRTVTLAAGSAERGGGGFVAWESTALLLARSTYGGRRKTTHRHRLFAHQSPGGANAIDRPSIHVVLPNDRHRDSRDSLILS